MHDYDGVYDRELEDGITETFIRRMKETFNIFFASRDLQGGVELDSLAESIALCRRMLMICSRKP